MAITQLWFGASALGAGDGSSHNNRALAYSGATWSSVLTGFNFTTGGCQAIIEQASYTPTGTLNAASFSNAPSVANPLHFVGGDPSGNILSPSQPMWTADQPVAWDANLPAISTTTDISALDVTNSTMSFLKFTASGRNGGVCNFAAVLNWCSVYQNTSNSAAIGIQTVKAYNTYIEMNGTSYSRGVAVGNAWIHDNLRIKGNSSASSGTRHAFVDGGTTSVRRLTRYCAFNHVGSGFISAGANVNQGFVGDQWVLVNTGGAALQNIASQLAINPVSRLMIVGSSGTGLDAGAANTPLMTARFRNNGTNFANFGNYPTNVDIYTTNPYGSQAAADAAEFADAANFDYRIKAGCPIWGRGFGVSDQIANRKTITVG